MNFDYTPDQVTLQDSLKRYLDKNYSFEIRQELSKSPLAMSEQAWKFFADLGILALPFDEEHGGLGGAPFDTLWIMETLGRYLTLEPYLSTALLCGSLIKSSASEAQKLDWIPRISEGSLKLALAHYEPDSRYVSDHVSTDAQVKDLPQGSAYVLNGYKNVVLFGHTANAYLISARIQDSGQDRNCLSLFYVEATNPGLYLHRYNTQDGSYACDLELKDCQIPGDHLIGIAGDALHSIEFALQHGNAALCAEATGIMTKMNELTLEYVKTRKQFGMAIGGFQALQHRLVEMLIQEEQSRSMSILAAQSLSQHDSIKRARDISAAKAFICKAAQIVGQEAIQLHGGIGVTHEVSIAHYFKRLTMITLILGDFNHHIDIVSKHLRGQA
jgi:alkylation response protein AidB-like acyl-CoA dehydrogenase